MHPKQPPPVDRNRAKQSRVLPYKPQVSLSPFWQYEVRNSTGCSRQQLEQCYPRQNFVRKSDRKFEPFSRRRQPFLQNPDEAGIGSKLHRCRYSLSGPSRIYFT